MDNVICYCKNITEADIDIAIASGAKTLNDIKTSTGACTGNRCKELNPSGKCCAETIIAILNNKGLGTKPTCCCCT